MKTDLGELTAGGSPAARALLAESERARSAVSPPILPRARAGQKLAAGTPLLDGEPFRIDEASARGLFVNLVETLRGDSEQAAAAEAIGDALVSGRLDLGRALEEALPAHADHVAAMADWARLPVGPLADLLELAVRPSLRAVAAAYAPLLGDGASWRRPYCPVCGAAGSSADRCDVRRCPRCATTWPDSVEVEVEGAGAFRIDLGEPEPDEALEDLLELD